MKLVHLDSLVVLLRILNSRHASGSGATPILRDTRSEWSVKACAVKNNFLIDGTFFFVSRKFH